MSWFSRNFHHSFNNYLKRYPVLNGQSALPGRTVSNPIKLATIKQ